MRNSQAPAFGQTAVSTCDPRPAAFFFLVLLIFRKQHSHTIVLGRPGRFAISGAIVPGPVRLSTGEDSHIATFFAGILTPCRAGVIGGESVDWGAGRRQNEGVGVCCVCRLPWAGGAIALRVSEGI